MRRGFALIEVVIAGVILAVGLAGGLAGIINVSMRAMEMQRRGEAEVIASSLLDGLLSQVLVDGVTEFPKLNATSGRLNATSGRFDPPFEDWEFEVLIDPEGLGDPYTVTALVRDARGQAYTAETRIAPRLGEDPNPDRRPPEPFDRQSAYEKDEEAPVAP
ncbi:MAG: hypothetical protein RLZZ217_2106 [Planctomycetota bacterium]